MQMLSVRLPAHLERTHIEGISFFMSAPDQLLEICCDPKAPFPVSRSMLITRFGSGGGFSDSPKARDGRLEVLEFGRSNP
jgi:hypothetical protein